MTLIGNHDPLNNYGGKDPGTHFVKIEQRQPDARTWSEAITDWQLATFGPVTPARAWARFDEEFNELVDADCEPTEPPEKIAEEAADVVITFAAWVRARTGLDLATAVERKMGINRARKWDVRADGTGYHVKPSGGAE